MARNREKVSTQLARAGNNFSLFTFLFSLLPLLSGILLSSPAMAQVNGFTQRGRATQEMGIGGLVIAHPSLPINSNATVTNTVTEKQMECNG